MTGYLNVSQVIPAGDAEAGERGAEDVGEDDLPGSGGSYRKNTQGGDGESRHRVRLAEGARQVEGPDGAPRCWLCSRRERSPGREQAAGHGRAARGPLPSELRRLLGRRRKGAEGVEQVRDGDGGLITREFGGF